MFVAAAVFFVQNPKEIMGVEFGEFEPAAQVICSIRVPSHSFLQSTVQSFLCTAQNNHLQQVFGWSDEQIRLSPSSSVPRCWKVPPEMTAMMGIVFICVIIAYVVTAEVAPPGSVPMRVINHAGAPIELYWINIFERHRPLVKQTQKAIRNNTETQINSYNTHSFVVKVRTSHLHFLHLPLTFSFTIPFPYHSVALHFPSYANLLLGRQSFWIPQKEYMHRHSSPRDQNLKR